jgi:hypothetical protein
MKYVSVKSPARIWSTGRVNAAGSIRFFRRGI